MNPLMSEYAVHHLSETSTQADLACDDINWLHRSFNKEFICFNLNEMINGRGDIYVSGEPSYYKAKKALKILMKVTTEFLDGVGESLCKPDNLVVCWSCHKRWPVLFCATFILMQTQTVDRLGLAWDHLIWLTREIAKRMKQYCEAEGTMSDKVENKTTIPDCVKKPERLDCVKKPEELEEVGNVHYEIVGYDRDMSEIIEAPLNIEQALEMALNPCGWALDRITVIRKVRVEEVYLPNANLIKKRPNKQITICKHCGGENEITQKER